MNGIIELLSTKYKEIPPAKINSGLCEDFAWAVCEIDSSFSLEYDDDYGHVYLYKDRLYFDAECPDGIEELYSLPYYERIKNRLGREL